MADFWRRRAAPSSHVETGGTRWRRQIAPRARRTSTGLGVGEQLGSVSAEVHVDGLVTLIARPGGGIGQILDAALARQEDTSARNAEIANGQHLATFVVQHAIIRTLARHTEFGASFVNALREEISGGIAAGLARALLRNKPHAQSVFDASLGAHTTFIEGEHESRVGQTSGKSDAD